MTGKNDLSPAFTPSRLGHVNMFVSDVERSTRFYSDVAGIELVRREPSIHGAFHSNGNTHHDVALFQVRDGARHGIGGFQQVSSFRGAKPGLNHFGWEMHSEADLIKALRRAKKTGLPIVNCSNHQIAHSVYVVDPDGNYHEFYADSVERWRTIFNLGSEELLTEAWDWEQSAPGLGPIPGDPADRRQVQHAVFHPRRIAHATLGARLLPEMVEFLTNVAGLNVLSNDGGLAMFRGVKSSFDLLLVTAEYAKREGLCGISFEIEDEEDLRRSEKTAARKGIKVIESFDLPHKRSVLVADPDGLTVEFYSPRAGERPTRRLPSGRDSDVARVWSL